MSYIKRSKKNGKVYLSEVETKRIDGKVVTKHLRYIGREANGTVIINISISDISIEQIKVYGPLLVLHHLAEEINLPTLLGKYGHEIMSMVYAHCLNFESVNQMPNWFERTDLNFLLKLDKLTESKLLRALDDLESQNQTELQRKIFNEVKSKYQLSSDGIVYDVTNTYFHGKKCQLAKFGKDKEGIKGRPLVQIGLGVTKDEGIPVFHKTFHGNIHDSRTFQDMINLFREYGIKNGLFVFDRGISSKQNQLNIKALGWKVICGLPMDKALKIIVRNTIANKDFLVLGNRIKLNKTIYYVEAVKHSIAGIKGTLYICFNERRRRDVIESRYDEIMHAQNLLKQDKPIKVGLEKFFSKNGKILIRRLREVEEFDGYSIIFTTEKFTKEKIIKMYFDKDLVEKAFQSLKGVIGLRPIRHWLYNRVISHVFICYLSYLLLSILKLRLNKIDVTPIKALKELDTLYKVYMRDSKKNFEFEKLVALTKNQEKILRAVSRKLIAQCRG